MTTSVVLCTYNGARFLPAQWASVLAQSRLPDEIVVHDDASTDATPTLLEHLAADARARGIVVKLCGNEHNVGYVANFQAALQEASGDVVILCDQDDVWHPRKLGSQLAAFERRPNLLLLCSDARRTGEDGSDLGPSLFDVLRLTRAEQRRIHAGRGFEVLLRRSMATGATVALRRTLLATALPVPPGWVHDEWLAIIAAALDGFDCLDFALVDYRQHTQNQIGMPRRGLRDRVAGLLDPRAATIDRLVARDEWLLRRLEQLEGNVPVAWRHAAQRKLAHLRARQAISGAPWSRLGPVLRESVNGRYRRFGSGWRSGLRDLVRRR
ncbi:MAG TPA: glycosyltransferase family 2 protein [Rhodanobacteraceae bacterium]|nr:glycosyltransferase family 2 protein [Rhodanobacteraceae bacterium]